MSENLRSVAVCDCFTSLIQATARNVAICGQMSQPFTTPTGERYTL